MSAEHKAAKGYAPSRGQPRADVAVVVINKNTRDFLRDCLRTISEQDYGGRITCWVVDNASADSSAAGSA